MSCRLLFVVVLCLPLQHSFLLATEPSQLKPRPDAAALRESEEEVRDSLPDLERAKKQSEKAALARECIKIASGTNDKESNRFVLLVLARDLAIESRDYETAVKASLAIADRYEPDGPTTGKEQFRKAKELWDRSNDVHVDERLKLRVEAVEWYARARTQVSDLQKRLCEKRISELGGMTLSSNDEQADLSRLIGTWEVQVGKAQSIWTFFANGTVVTNERSGRGHWTGQWQLNDHEVRLSWNHEPKRWDTFARPIKQRVSGSSSYGRGGVVHATKANYWAINAVDDWQPTVEIRAGQRVEITAKGTWSVYKIMKEADRGPNGREGFAGGWLEGKVGDGKVIRIGERHNFVANSDGMLSFRINDTYREDNDGTLNVTITVKGP
jgi:hypothetical protein